MPKLILDNLSVLRAFAVKMTFLQCSHGRFAHGCFVWIGDPQPGQTQSRPAWTGRLIQCKSMKSVAQRSKD